MAGSDLIEVPVFSTNVHVPNPGEEVTAESVTVPFQSLANRTQKLRGQLIGGYRLMGVVGKYRDIEDAPAFSKGFPNTTYSTTEGDPEYYFVLPNAASVDDGAGVVGQDLIEVTVTTAVRITNGANDGWIRMACKYGGAVVTHFFPGAVYRITQAENNERMPATFHGTLVLPVGGTVSIYMLGKVTGAGVTMFLDAPYSMTAKIYRKATV